ncbi:MAG: hypothetical protein KIT40_15705 [Nitrospira sp.]|nr:hypothetical protein [Nitrospira sp.]
MTTVPNAVRADCVDGVRNATPEEVAFAARAEAALAAALPAPIADSERRGGPFDFSRQPRLSFCKADQMGAFAVSVGGGYLYTFPKTEADRLYAERKGLEKQIDDLEKLPPDKDAEYKQVLARMKAAYEAAPRRSRKDPPFTPEQQEQVTRAMAEGKKLEDAAKKVVADHVAGVKPQTDVLRAQAKRLETYPQELAVRLVMNTDRFPESGTTVATYGTPSAGRSTGLTVHNVVMSVEGPEGIARQTLFDAVDKAYLQGLIGQPLPEVEASKARAERNTRAPVAGK